MPALYHVEADHLLIFLAHVLHCEPEDAAQAIDDGFQRAYPESLGEKKEQKRQWHLVRLTEALTGAERRIDLRRLWTSLSDLRDASEAEAVRAQVDEYLRVAVVPIERDLCSLMPGTPDAPTAECALRLVRRHHGRPKGAWRCRVKLPRGEYELGFGQRPQDPQTPRAYTLPGGGYGYFGPWDLDDRNYSALGVIAERQRQVFSAALRVLCQFAARCGIDAGPLKDAWDSDLAGRIEIAIRAGGQISKGRVAGITVAEANERAMELARKDPGFVRKKQREWAKEIGCSVGLVGKLPFWCQMMKMSGRGRKDKPKQPKAVSLTDAVLASHGQEDEALQKLIEAAATEPAIPEPRRAREYRRL